jgi:hypothetical protein
MDIDTFTYFLMWCTILNCALLVLWTIAFRLMPDLVYKSQKIFFPTVTKEQFALIMYGFVGFFKVLFVVFNLVPFAVLLIIS